MLDELTDRVRRQEALRWDELRERRVLAKTFGLVRRRQQRQLIRKRLSLAAGAALLVAAGAAVGAHLWTEASAHPIAAAPRGSETRVELPGGAVAVLGNGAELKLGDYEADAVRVVQRSGEVSYEVSTARGTRFIVDVADVRVAVTGTRFTVAREDGWVWVRVSRGRAELDDRVRTLSLIEGEEIRLRAFLPRGRGAAASQTATAPPPYAASNEDDSGHR